jgi:hypothetical protein
VERTADGRTRTLIIRSRRSARSSEPAAASAAEVRAPVARPVERPKQKRRGLFDFDDDDD